MQRWLIGGAVLVGSVLLAVFLIPSPDTGDSIQSAERHRPAVEPLLDRRAGVELRKRTSNSLDKPKTRKEIVAAGQRMRADNYRGKQSIKDLTSGSSDEVWSSIDMALQDFGKNEEIGRLRKSIEELRTLTVEVSRGRGSKEDLVKHQDLLLEEFRTYKIASEPNLRKMLSKVESQIARENKLLQ